nr:PREDICTED: uncharacterized protein LOC109038815 [Bemisia tabaci]
MIKDLSLRSLCRKQCSFLVKKWYFFLRKMITNSWGENPLFSVCFMKCDRNRGSPILIYTEPSKIKQLMRSKFVKCLHCVLLLFFTCMVSESDGAVGRKQFKTWQELDYRQIAYAIKDFALALPTQHFTLILDVNVDDEFYEIITELFREQGFLHSLYVIKSVKSLKMASTRVLISSKTVIGL